MRKNSSNIKDYKMQMNRIIITACLIAAFTNLATAQTSLIGTMPTQRELERAQMTLGSMSFTAMPAQAPKVFREHDLVTVIVSKDWRQTNKGTMERKKNMKADYKITKWPSFTGLFGIGASTFEDGAPAIGGSIDSKFKNQGTITRREQLEFKITCEIASIQENGILYLEGLDTTTLGEEGKIIYCSGYARPQDVQPNNSVKSEIMFSFDIREIPSGSVQDSIRRNWAQKLIDRYSPF
jgi:flagellar L-ring protein precursor FlgH